MNIAVILDDCLIRLTRGESVADCLARYPEQAAELAPMLAAAGRLRSLATCELTAAQRLAGVAAIQRAWTTQMQAQGTSGRAAWLSRWGAMLKRPALVVVAACCLFVVLSAGAVAASQPGDLVYGVRVVVERAPVLVIFDSGARAAAELNLAERRLTDLQYALQRNQQVDKIALRALIRSEAAAADAAGRLTAVERRQFAARVEALVGRLALLAETAPDPTATQLFAQAASQARGIAERLQGPSSGDTEPIELPPQPIMPSATTTLAETPGAVTPTAVATPEATPIRPDTPTATIEPTRAPTGWPRESETPRRPPAAATRIERATAIAATVAARPTLAAPAPVVTRLASPPVPTRVLHLTATLRPIIATRRAESTAELPRPTPRPPRPTPRPPRPTPRPPRPTDNPAATPGLQPHPSPARGWR